MIAYIFGVSHDLKVLIILINVPLGTVPKRHRKENTMNKYSKLLAEQHSLSRLCVDREKLATDEILGIELTIQDVDVAKDVIIDGEATTFSVYVFKEFPDKYVYGGMKLTAVAESLMEISAKDRISVDKMDVHIMLKQVQLKNKNTFTDVQFL